MTTLPFMYFVVSLVFSIPAFFGSSARLLHFTNSQNAGSTDVEVIQTNCINDSKFVKDITIPDDTIFAPGETFTKTWRLLNKGTCPWSQSYKWSWIQGIQMAGADTKIATKEVIPGEMIDISVAFTAPPIAGTFRSNWKLQSPDGTLFGSQAWVQIVVKESLPGFSPADFEQHKPTPSINYKEHPNPQGLDCKKNDQDALSGLYVPSIFVYGSSTLRSAKVCIYGYSSYSEIQVDLYSPDNILYSQSIEIGGYSPFKFSDTEAMITVGEFPIGWLAVMTSGTWMLRIESSTNNFLRYQIPIQLPKLDQPTVDVVPDSAIKHPFELPYVNPQQSYSAVGYNLGENQTYDLRIFRNDRSRKLLSQQVVKTNTSGQFNIPFPVDIFPSSGSHLITLSKAETSNIPQSGSEPVKDIERVINVLPSYGSSKDIVPASVKSDLKKELLIGVGGGGGYRCGDATYDYAGIFVIGDELLCLFGLPKNVPLSVTFVAPNNSEYHEHELVVSSTGDSPDEIVAHTISDFYFLPVDLIGKWKVVIESSVGTFKTEFSTKVPTNPIISVIPDSGNNPFLSGCKNKLFAKGPIPIWGVNYAPKHEIILGIYGKDLVYSHNLIVNSDGTFRHDVPTEALPQDGEYTVIAVEKGDPYLSQEEDSQYWGANSCFSLRSNSDLLHREVRSYQFADMIVCTEEYFDKLVKRCNLPTGLMNIFGIIGTRTNDKPIGENIYVSWTPSLAMKGSAYEIEICRIISECKPLLATNDEYIVLKKSDLKNVQHINLSVNGNFVDGETITGLD